MVWYFILQWAAVASLAFNSAWPGLLAMVGVLVAAVLS